MSYAILVFVGFCGLRGIPICPRKGPGTSLQIPLAEYSDALEGYAIFRIRGLPARPRKGWGAVTQNTNANIDGIFRRQVGFRPVHVSG